MPGSPPVTTPPKLTTWDKVRKTTGFSPEKEENKEEVFTIAELYAKAGKFPFKVRKVKESPKHPQSRHSWHIGFQTTITDINRQRPGYPYHIWRRDNSGWLADSSSWRFA
jgi:hypothetical protein